MNVQFNQSVTGDGWPTVNTNYSFSGGATNSFSQTINSGGQSVQYTYQLPTYAKMIATYLEAGFPAQIKVNASGGASLLATLNLQSGCPILWNINYSGLYASPWGSGAEINDIWVTTSGAAGVLNIRSLYDATSG